MDSSNGIVTLESASPEEIRKAALGLLRVVDGGLGSMAVNVVDVGGRTSLSGVTTTMPDSRFNDARFRDVSRVSGATFDYASRPVRERRRFLRQTAIFGSRAAAAREAIVRDMQAPFGVVDQLRLLVFQRNRFVCSVGTVRFAGEPGFTARDEQVASRYVAAVSKALIAADGLERGGGEPADLVVRPNGSVEYASVSGAQWLEQDGFRRELVASVAAFDRGEDFPQPLALERAAANLVRLDGAAGVRYLVHVEPAAPILAMPALSTRQRDVAAAAARGATLKEAAAELGISVDTAKAHLAAAYRVLGVKSRAELAAAWMKARRTLRP